MLSVVMLSVAKLSVVAPIATALLNISSLNGQTKLLLQHL